MRKVNSLLFILLLTLVLLLLAGCVDNGREGNTPAAGDNYEEGTSAADSIINTTASDKVILVVSFGTSFNQSRSLTIGGIETAIKNAYPDYQVRRAFTSQIIIDKLAAREDLQIDNVTEAMDRLVLDKVKEVIIQPTTVMNGFEYDDIIAGVMPYADKFESLKIGKHLLSDDIDYSEVTEAMVKHTSEHRAEGTAIVYMGHGTEHQAVSTYARIQDTLKAKGYSDYVIGTVEHGLELDYVQEILKTMGVEKVVLAPLMIVAGDHANNDMAGNDGDSWKTILTEDGYEVETIIEGLGQLKDIQDLFIRHVQEAIDSDDQSVAAAAHAVGVTADRIKNGTYSIKVDSNTSMFKIVDCRLTVEDNRMTAVMTLSGKGFSKIYMGGGEQALKDTESNFHNYTDNGEQHYFTVPVQALDREIDCAGFSMRKEQWYDHIVVFESADIPGDAFLPRRIDVAMSGGSGRASIESPAELTYNNGVNYAKVVWNSPNYTYMLVDGEEYLPVNAGGNSTFLIPVALDEDMKVVACTVAMSEPKEVEYTLNFNPASIK